MNMETLWTLRPGLLGVLDALRLAAFFVGYLLSGVGGLGYGCAFLLGAPHGLVPSDNSLFCFLGFLIVPGWLLLRFASGRFPFGKRLFR